MSSSYDEDNLIVTATATLMPVEEKSGTEKDKKAYTCATITQSFTGITYDLLISELWTMDTHL